MGRTSFSGYDAQELMEALVQLDEGALRDLRVGSLDEITGINLSRSSLSALPPEIGRLSNLQTLSLDGTQLSVLPPEVGAFTNLRRLWLHNTSLSALAPEIGQLTNLQNLWLYNTRLSILPPEIGRLTKLQTLYLSDTPLTALPPEIGDLVSLQQLDLDNTQLFAIPPEIGELKILRELRLNNTQLSYLPPEIGKLTELKTLSLHDTPLSSLPPEIGWLTNLRELDLSNTQLSALPSEIGRLTNLQTLRLNDTQLSVLPPEIGQLTKLQTLYLSNTQLSSLPPEIGQLTSLQTLWLHNTPLSSLPPGIGGLTSLKVLRLYKTKLSTIPPIIGQLKNLQVLYLDGTQLSTIPPDIGQLSNLQELYLDGTQLYALPPEIGQLTNLHWLSLSGTQLSALPPEIGGLKDLRFISISDLNLKEIPKAIFDFNLPFYLSDEMYQSKKTLTFGSIAKGVVMENTVLRTQPVSLFGLDREMIRAYYEEEKVPVREGKVIFLGDGGAGKSHTIERILKNGSDLGINTKQTPGISIRPWKPDRGDKQVSINFWDFGGQEILHAMHRCFLTGRSLYVVVLRQRSESRHNDLTLQARYWLENIRSFAPNCPVILAVNREQGVAGSSGVNTRQLREELEFKTIVGEPIVYCAREDRDDNFGALTKAILDQALLLDSTEMEFPRTWNEVRTALETMSNRRDRKGSKPYIDKEKYKELCIEQGITNEDIQRWLLEWFNDLGVCFSYHQEEGKELERYQVLNPEWLTNAIYALIMIGRQREFSDNGVITRGDIRDILEHPSEYASERTAQRLIVYNKNEQGYVLDIMKKFNLCAQIDAKSFYIPALCSPETPENFRPGAEEYTDHTRFEFRYGFLPDSVIHRLMIECIRAGFHRTASYFGGIRVDFIPDEVTLTAEADTAKNVLAVDVYHKNDPDACRSKLAWVRKKVAEINTSMNLTPDCEILVICDGENRADLELDFLFSLYESGEKNVTLRAYQKGKFIKYPLIVALRLLYSPSVIENADAWMQETGREKTISYRDALTLAELNMQYLLGISFAGEQRDFVRQICDCLCGQSGFSRANVFFDEWHEHLINGAEGAIQLDRVYSRQCKKVVVLLSEAYLNKHWTNKVEWNRAISNRIVKDPEDVCLLQFGPIDIDSVDLLHSGIAITKDISKKTPKEAAEFIVKWYNRSPM